MRNAFIQFKNNYWEQSKGMLLLMLMILLSVGYFSARYTFAYNGAISDCLNSRFFLVDTWTKEIKRGELAAFVNQNDTRLFKKGGKWIKMVAAKGGDNVRVTYDNLKVNDSITYNVNLWYTLSKLGMEMSEIKQDIHLEPNQLFMIGETSTSYDSRYWGPIEQTDVFGRAYAIF